MELGAVVHVVLLCGRPAWKTGEMVSKSVVCPWDVSNTDIIVALGG